jgi:signal transduction histidine kinase
MATPKLENNGLSEGSANIGNPEEAALEKLCQQPRSLGCKPIEEEITKRRALERETADLRLRAKTMSQQAGMAEVATTALHNVGNVLNSVNVSASVVVQRLRESRVHNMGKALALFREHPEDLARFLSEDPKGRMLPGYLETLAEHLIAEHGDLLREMEALTRSVEHMREIVTVQQTYARKCGVVETLPPAELVEDALRMNCGAFERHGVTVVREFTSTSPLTADKHKVLQILVNLIRNAKYAMDELGGDRKVLTLEISSRNERTLSISVRDTGIGIGSENLDRIFDHGFTTRREGHGFGLYSGRMAATEMGGKLTARSEGLGQGAVFCLELPLAQKPVEHDDARGNEIDLPRC